MREEIEALALLAISRGHDVAQLNFDGIRVSADGRPIPFGLIIRRGRI